MLGIMPHSGAGEGNLAFVQWVKTDGKEHQLRGGTTSGGTVVGLGSCGTKDLQQSLVLWCPPLKGLPVAPKTCGPKSHAPSGWKELKHFPNFSFSLEK